MTRRSFWTTVLGGVLLGAVPAARQAPDGQEPLFRAGTRTVPIYATATDDLGQFVLDLQRDEFEVRDNGQVQPLSLFTKDVQPLTGVVLLDGSRSMVNAIETVITAADHFVVRLMPGDEALVGSFSDEIRLARTFSPDRDALARDVNNLLDLRMGPGTRLWDAIGQAAQVFEGAEGRRVIVVFTDGEDTTSLSTSEDALRRARRADAMVYAVLIRGMERPPEKRLNRRRGRPQDLAEVAMDTGGGYYSVGNVLDDMNAIATQVAQELHSQYVLGFVPQRLDGAVHRLEVRVKRSGVKIRARESYLASEEGGGTR